MNLVVFFYWSFCHAFNQILSIFRFLSKKKGSKQEVIFAELEYLASFACADVQAQQWALMINIRGPVSGDKARLFSRVFPAAGCPVDSLSSEDKCFLSQPGEERSVHHTSVSQKHQKKQLYLHSNWIHIAGNMSLVSVYCKDSMLSEHVLPMCRTLYMLCLSSLSNLSIQTPSRVKEASTPIYETGLVPDRNVCELKAV